MVDEMDEAQALADLHIQHSITEAISRRHVAGRENCVDCELAIPEARRKANPEAIRCVDCQEEFEAGTPNIKGRI